MDERAGLPSASAMERLAGCPGSVAASAGVKGEDTEVSEKGTRLHESYETGDTSNLALAEVDLLSLVAKQENQLLNAWLERFEIDPQNVVIEREERHWVHKGLEPLCSGKLDFAAISERDGRALILDLKSGWKTVTVPVRNLQLRTLAVCLWSEFPKIKHVRVGIIQPMTQAEEPCDYEALDLLAAYDQVVETIELTKLPNAPRHVGKWCDYCPAKTDCPEAREHVTQAVKPLERWDVLTPADKVRLFDACNIATSIIKDIKARLKAELSINPLAIPGLVKKADQKPREVKSAVEFYTQLIQSVPDDMKEKAGQLFRDACSISVGDCVKIYRELTGASAKEADEWIAPIVKFGFKSGSVDKE